MTTVDFLVANTGHHLASARPVAEELSRRGFRCRLASICELRGLPSPDLGGNGLQVIRLVSRGFRHRPPRRAGGSASSPRLRALLRVLLWRAYLARRVRSWLHAGPRVVSVPNDAAFPYDAICRELKRRRIRFVVLQEGIRFAETASESPEILRQGLSGADAIACWGESSAEFFRSRGAAPASIQLTGCPRFDMVRTTDWSSEAESLSKLMPPGKTTLTIFTNPIEVWGFCSSAGKMELLERLLAGIRPLFEQSNLRLVFKIHRQESLEAYRNLVAADPYEQSMTVLDEASLYPLLELSDAALVLASTVGLEAMLAEVPLGVLEIPGHGFVHDFVSSGAARGIAWSLPIAEQVRALLSDEPGENPQLAAYLERALHARGHATQNVADLIADLSRAPRSPG